VTDTNIFQLCQPGSFADPLTEVLRNGARALLMQAVEAEVAALLRSHADKLTDDSSDIGTAETRAWLLKFRLRCKDLTQFPRASYRGLLPQTCQTSSR
jgi:hypothetical protein